MTEANTDINHISSGLLLESDKVCSKQKSTSAKINIHIYLSATPTVSKFVFYSLWFGYRLASAPVQDWHRLETNCSIALCHIKICLWKSVGEPLRGIYYDKSHNYNIKSFYAYP